MKKEYFLALLTTIIMILATLLAVAVIFAGLEISDQSIEVRDIPPEAIPVQPLAR